MAHHVMIFAKDLEHGGLAKDPWAWEGRRYCECADVEGNSLQLFAI